MKGLRLAAALALGMLAVDSPALADVAQVDQGRVKLGVEGRDRGGPRPIALAIGLSQAVRYAVAVIAAPPRLVVDLRDTGIPSQQPPPTEPLALRWGPGPQGGARAVLTLPGPMNLELAQMIA